MLPPPKGWVCRHRRGRTLTRAATEGRMFEAVNKYGERYEVWPDKAAAFGRWAGVKETSGNFARRRRHCHRHQLPLPPPPSPASSSPGGKQAKPALLRPCALHPRPCELPASLLPASGVAGDAVATLCASSRGTGARLPHPAYAHASAALAWQAVAVQMGLAAGSRSGGRQVAKSRVAFCRSFRLRGSPRSEAGFA